MCVWISWRCKGQIYTPCTGEMKAISQAGCFSLFCVSLPGWHWSSLISSEPTGLFFHLRIPSTHRQRRTCFHIFSLSFSNSLTGSEQDHSLPLQSAVSLSSLCPLSPTAEVSNLPGRQSSSPSLLCRLYRLFPVTQLSSCCLNLPNLPSQVRWAFWLEISICHLYSLWPEHYLHCSQPRLHNVDEHTDKFAFRMMLCCVKLLFSLRKTPDIIPNNEKHWLFPLFCCFFQIRSGHFMENVMCCLVLKHYINKTAGTPNLKTINLVKTITLLKTILKQ